VPGPPAPPGPPGLQYPADRVAAALLEAADLLEAFGENPHRVRAYRRGAEVLVRHADRFAGLLVAGRLTELPGIGRELAAKAREVADTGALAAVAALKARIPPAAAALGGVPGVDRKTAIYLASRLRVTTVADLAALAGTHLLRAVPWLGPEGGRRIEAGVRAVAGR
jgi:DNA polymerase (family X)